VPKTTTPRKADSNTLRDRMTRSLDAAIEEAERVGYVSAEEGKRRTDELLKAIKRRAAAGQIKP
jgi:hypothetical protein